MWQYTSKGSVSGVNGNCDCNYAYKDFTAIIKKKGLNGFKKQKNNELSILEKSGYKKGDKTSGVLALKEMLIIAKARKLHNVTLDENSIFGEGTEKAVNALLKKWGYKQNSVAGEKFIKKLASAIK